MGKREKRKERRRKKRQERRKASSTNATPPAILAVAKVTSQQSISQEATFATLAAYTESSPPIALGVEEDADEQRTLQNEVLTITGVDKEYSINGRQENIGIPLSWSLPFVLQSALQVTAKQAEKTIT